MPNTSGHIQTPNATADTVAGTPYYPPASFPQGNIPEQYQHMPVRSSGVLLLLVFSFLLVAFCYRTGRKYFHTIFSNLWSVKRTKNHLDNHTANETITMAALIVQTLIMEGIILYCAISSYYPAMLTIGTSQGMAALIGIAAAYYIAQLSLLKLIGFVFAESIETELWTQGFNASQSIMGQLLAPIAIIMLFNPAHNELMLIFAASLYILARLLFLLKSFRIFFNSFFQCFYFILYLCAVEIIPLIFACKSIDLTY